MPRFARGSLCILGGALLLMFWSALSLASDAVDIDAIRTQIDENGWSFEVDDTFSRSLTPAARTNLRGYNPPPDYQKILDANLKIFPVNKNFATNLDWRDVGGITPVKNQGECGSCWAFAATAEMEAFIKIYYGVETDLSEQQIVSCNPYGASCAGGWANAAYFVFQQYGGVLENCMPYVGQDPPMAPCVQNDYKKYGYVTGWHSISNNVEQIKAALQDGPVCTAVDAGPEFEAYASGCYDVPGGWTNHLVLIVGYDDRACNGNGAWIIKNSWGSDFGEAGYITIQYGAGSTGTSVTQLEYAAPPVSVDISPALASAPIYGDQPAVINWSTSGSAAPLVDIWFGADGHCHETLVAENVPNTGSFDWMVPNLGTDYGSLVIHPSTGTDDGFGFTTDYIQLIGHKTRYVSLAGSNTAPYDTPETAAHSINAAVAACTGTDSVLVAGGNYIGTVAVGSTVRLLGGFSSDFSQRDTDLYPSVIQSGSTGMRFLEGSGDYGMADGFVFRNCTGSNSSEPVSGRHGGGIFIQNASPVITNCLFENNLADPGNGVGYGGAICVVGGSPLITSCTFNGNVASRGGAIGVFSGAETTIEDCQIVANSCSDSLSSFTGAGIYAEASILNVSGGSLINNGGSGTGGGLSLLDATAGLNRVELRGNRAQGNGGGIQSINSSVQLRNMEVLGNASAGGSGGGLALQSGSLDICNVRISGNHSSIMGGGLFGTEVSGRLENCLIRENASASGGGLVMFSNAGTAIRNNNIIANSGGGIMAAGVAMAVENNNVWQNAGLNYQSMTAPASDISLDPLFVGPAAGDFGLAQFSPCIDRGADDPACLDPDGSRADIGLLGGPGADFVAPARVTGAQLTDLGGGSWRLSWAASTEPDVDHYVVYRDTTAQFTPSPLKALASVAHPQTFLEDTPGMDCYYLVAAVDTDSYSGGYSDRVSTTGGVSAAPDSDLPRSLAIAKVVPNPFNPRTTLSYEVPHTSKVRLGVYDIRGRLVEVLVSGTVEAGRHSVDWNGRDRNGQSVAAGVYFARMSDGRSVTTSKLVLAK